MRIKKTPARLIFIISFLVCCLALSFTMYLEMVQGLQPCPLCVFQRIIVIVLGVFFLVASIHGPKGIGVRIYSFFFSLICVAGISLSIRQVWLQSLPPEQAPSCGAGIGYMFENMPLKDFFLAVFQGTSDCAVVHWQFLSLSIAGWSTVFFAVLGFIHLWHIFRHIPRNFTQRTN